jgi:MFS-type transporter involved in bile tolerance (Atg22 family)
VADQLLTIGSGNEIGPFRAIEESTLAHLTPVTNRGDIYAWYSLIGTAGAAGGMFTCGWVVQSLQIKSEWDVIRTYRAVFWGYAAFGILKFLFSVTLSKHIEAEKKSAPVRDAETAPLLGDGAEDIEPKKSYIRSLLPEISAESRVIIVNLCILFALDAFASGLAPLSWVTFFFHEKFGISDGKLGSLFFTTSIIAAASMLLASSIAKRFGNVQVSSLHGQSYNMLIF